MIQVYALKRGTMSNLINSYCLTCTKPKCRGYCKEITEYTKSLVKKGIIAKRGGHKKNKKEPI